jgi:hypothetical protein
VFRKPLTVVAKDRGVEHRLVDPQIQEPAEQQVVIDPFHQLRLGTDGIDRLEQKRLDQPLRRHAGPALLGIRRIQSSAHLSQVLIDHPFDGAQRMIGADALFQIDCRGEQNGLRISLATHP